MFRPVATLRQLTTKYLIAHSSKIVLTVLCIWMYRCYNSHYVNIKIYNVQNMINDN